MTARTYRALLVANSTFPDDPQNLPELEGPRNDAALLRDALCDRDYGLFAPDNVRLVQERTMGDVLREMEDFLRSASRQDTVLIYYSGHGVLDQSNEFFLCTNNSRVDRLRSTAVKASDVSQMIDESAAATTLIFLDCCHSGKFKGGDLPGKLAGEGRFVVTSSRGGELAQDAHTQNHASLFTHHLVQGLMGRAADPDHDGLVSLSDLYGYVHDELRDAGRQIPQKRFEGSGDVPIAMRPGTDTEAAQPGLLDPAVVPPILDVSETQIDLGQVGADEQLPPERIVVINRGGGTLAWSVRASADWVVPVADETGVDLFLHPQPGPNRANVFITDETTGALKTVRISVRVGDGVGDGMTGPQPRVPVTPAAIASLTPSVEPGVEPPVGPPGDPQPTWARRPRSPGGDRKRLATRFALSAYALVILAAVVHAWSAGVVSEQIVENDPEKAIFLRSTAWVGLAESALLAAAAGAAAALGLVRRRQHPRALAAAATVALTLGILRITERTQFADLAYMTNTWSWFGRPPLFWFLAAAAAAVALVLSGERAHRPVMPTSEGVVAIGLVVVWTISLAQDIYDVESNGLLGNHTADRSAGRGWQLTLLALLVVLTVTAALCLGKNVVTGVMIGVTALAVAIVIAEMWFVVDSAGDFNFSWRRMWIIAVPAAALVWWSWREMRAAPRDQPNTNPR